MAVPWLRIFDAFLGLSDLARVVRRPPPPAGDGGLATTGPQHALEKTLTSVVVAALKEAFDRDHQRLELERERIEAERLRAERALRAELIRQAADREISRLRLLAGVAATSWLATLFFSTRLLGEGIWPRVALGAGWLLLLAALAVAFIAQSHVGVALTRTDDRADGIAPSVAGAMAPWLIVSGLAAIAFAVLLA